MNRILRRWFPKGTNFDQVTEAEVAQAAEWMNNYPAPDPGVEIRRGRVRGVRSRLKI